MTTSTTTATPLVSGVVALMLEANPDLSWRDVQHVLIDSARRNDPTDTDWVQNGAGRWVNHKYGFGAVDAAAAVGLAETWTSVGPEVKVSSGTQVVGLGIPDNNTVGVTSSFTVSSEIATEWVEVTFAATHPYRGDLEVVLTSPSGTSSVLAEAHDDFNADYQNWKFTSARNWGETSVGTWTLTVKDLGAADVGTWTSWSLDVYGTNVAPSVEIASSAAEPIGIGQTSTITFTLSEPSTDFAIGNVTVSGGTLSPLGVSGLVYTATFTPSASFEGTASISVQAGTFTDVVGYPNPAAGPLSIPVDTVAPTVTIARTGTGTLTIGMTDTITFTLSEPSTDFTVAAVTVVGGTLDTFTGSGVNYSATFTPDKQFTGMATASVAAAAFTDLAQNANFAGGPLGIPVDTAAPLIVGFSSPTPFTTVGIGGTVVIVAEFSEPVTTGGVVTVQFNSGASLQLVVDSTGLVASGTYLVQPGEVADDLDVVAIVPDGSIADAVGNLLVDTPPVTGFGLADQCGIVVDGAVKVGDSGDFSTNPALVWDVKSRFRQIPVRFSTPVTGVTVHSFVVYQNDAPIPMRGAKVSGTGLQYTLSLPISRARPVGLYRLDIAPDSGIVATANGAAASTVSSIRWGHARSLGVLPDAPAALAVTPSAPSRGIYAATLSWTTPAGNAGGAVIDYTVEYRAVGSATWLRVRRAFPAATTSATIQGLAAGKAYEFRVTARNAFGVGASALGVTPSASRPRHR